MENRLRPPGWPGIPPRWTSSAKSGIGTALNHSSRVWFTLSHGILDEVYYPRVDQACTRDMGLIVTDGGEFFSEEKRQTDQQIKLLAEGVPAYHLINTCLQGRYRIEKEILADPRRDALLQKTRFTPLLENPEEYHLYLLLAPHLGNRGSNNTAWIGDYKGVPMLFAEREGTALALASSAPWLGRSAGFVGVSDGWQDLQQHKQLTWQYARAEDGNVALTGEVDLDQAKNSFVLALGFGMSAAEAGQRALASLLDGFESARSIYIQEWQDWNHKLAPLGLKGSEAGKRNLYTTSAAVLRTHESKRFPGGLIASLSIPWGMARGDDDLGGYHLVWPRDLVEAAGGLLAAGAHADAHRILHYLQVTQEADGHWPQNMWLDGLPYWEGIQMDETAFPILLVDLASRENALSRSELIRFWPMVKRAAGFLVRNGPVTPQDRWEEDPGFSPFTLAVEVAALLVSADLADRIGEAQIGTYLRETADTWNSNIERWTYVTDTDLARRIGVEGYYVRIAPPEGAASASPAKGFVPIKNRPPGQGFEKADFLVSPDALALVRFGLRAADDPRILNTIKVIDTVLKTDTPFGPAWHRYNEDGYGEKPDGEPFDGSGIGRAWPLLTGERAHFELASGSRRRAVQLLHALEAFSNQGGLISEQIWDAPDIPEKELFFGRPSGSAMPLVWAHAEYIKLLRSLQDGRVFDTPPQAEQRYAASQLTSPYAFWRFNHKVQTIAPGKKLRIELPAPATVHYSFDEWQATFDLETQDPGLGVFIADLPTETLKRTKSLVFTFRWSGTGEWQGQNYRIQLREA